MEIFFWYDVPLSSCFERRLTWITIIAVIVDAFATTGGVLAILAKARVFKNSFFDLILAEVKKGMGVKRVHLAIDDDVEFVAQDVAMGEKCHLNGMTEWEELLLNTAAATPTTHTTPSFHLVPLRGKHRQSSDNVIWTARILWAVGTAIRTVSPTQIC